MEGLAMELADAYQRQAPPPRVGEPTPFPYWRLEGFASEQAWQEHWRKQGNRGADSVEEPAVAVTPRAEPSQEARKPRTGRAVCGYCGRPLKRKRRDSKYCGNPCRTAAWRLRHDPVTA